MKKKNLNDVVLFETRREWKFNPCVRVEKSKKNYNRKDKSWMKEI